MGIAVACNEAAPAGLPPAGMVTSDIPVATPTVPAPTSLHPDDLRTGITGLDPVLEAVASRDPEAIAARLQLLETACTTADGLGGPPKCDEGMADGTPVTVFPILGSEGTFVPAEGLADLANSLAIEGLFGVYQVAAEPNPEEAYWPSGVYGVVLAGNGSVPAYTLLVDRGNIVRIIYHLGGSPEQAFDAGRGAILIPPLQ